jgi:hypothetical protein
MKKLSKPRALTQLNRINYFTKKGRDLKKSTPAF